MRQYGLCLARPEIIERFCDVVVRGAEDRGGEQGGVDRAGPADCKRANRDAGICTMDSSESCPFNALD